MPTTVQFVPANPAIYQLVNNSDAVVKQLSADGLTYLSIPMVDGNADYADYQTWLAAGNTPLPPSS